MISKCLRLFIILFLGNLSAYCQLSGTYTIGGSTPDYISVTDAVSDLNSVGVNGPVVFNIRDGIYVGRLDIGDISGTTTTNTITFQSESLDSSLVKITASNYYAITLYQTKHITFAHLTIECTSTSSPSIAISSSTSGPTENVICDIFNCNLSSSAVNSFGNSTYRSVCSLSGANAEIRNSTFTGSNFGLYFAGGGNYNSLIVDSCVFVDQYYSGIHAESFTPLSIANSYIKSSTAVEGIFLDGFQDEFFVIGNEIHLGDGSGGIGIGVYHGFPSNNNQIINNMITVAGSSSSRGILIESMGMIDIFHNTINAYGHGGDAIAVVEAHDVNILNNIFSAGRFPVLIDANSQNEILIMDHNNFFEDGVNTVAGIWGASQITSLVDWQLITGHDANSTEVNPQFLSDTVLTIGNYQLNNTGNPAAGVLEDIYENNRSLTTPDVGAIEWSQPPSDASISAMNNGANLDCITTDSVFATLLNPGTDPLTSVTINWMINGVAQTPFLWTGNLSTGQEESVHIGDYLMNYGTGYSAKIWPTLPNGVNDTLPNNDTLFVDNTVHRMNGVYTIGGSLPDYNTIIDAVTDLEAGGVCGPVVFNIRDGVYNEQIEINTFFGASSMNTVTFQNENLDSTLSIISFASMSSGNNHTLKVDDQDHLIFRHLTIEATGLNYDDVVKISNSSNITLESCVFQGSSSGDGMLVYNYGGFSGAGFTVNNCKFIDGISGISCDVEDVNFNSNEFYNQSYLGISATTNDAIVKSNTMELNGAGTHYGIKIVGADSTIVSNNSIVMNGNNTNGIYLEGLGHSVPPQTSWVSNNFISITGTGNLKGISIRNSYKLRIIHNSVHTYGNNNDYGVYHYHNNGANTDIDLMNNIISVSSGGYALQYSLNSLNNLINSDYNDLYTSGNTLARMYISSSMPSADLASWQINSGKDANSLSIPPGFTSNTDLHICNALLNGQGVYFPEVPMDIDSGIRANPDPDIGADEFYLSSTSGLELPVDTAICDTLTLTIGAPNANYLWSTGESTNSIQVHSSGIYFVEINDGSCPTFNDSIDITIDSNIVFSLGPDTLACGITPVTLQTGVSGLSYLWSTNEVTEDIQVSAVGSYYVEITDGWCLGADTINVDYLPYPSVEISASDSVTCSGTTVSLNASGGTDYFWVQTSDISSSIDVTPTASQTFQVIGTVSGCSDTAQIFIDILQPVVYNQFVDACFSYEVNGTTYSSSQVIYDTLVAQSANGCDSIVITDLTINVADVSVLNNDPTLTANSSNASYQWLDCNNNMSPISGAINQSFIPVSNGSYAVVITENTCIDTSACENVLTVNIDELMMTEDFLLFPNPANDITYISTEIEGTKEISLTSFDGKLVWKEEWSGVGELPIPLSVAPGVYIIHFNSTTGSKGVRLLVKR